MAWRFKASKYKNAAPIVPKVEMCIREVCVGSYQTYGNNVCASASLMAFPWEHAGASMAVLPLDDAGRKSKTMPLLHAHADTVTGMEFSPFHDGLLATGSQDCLVKIWHIPETGLNESLSTAECTLSQRQRRVETLGFNPVADGLLHVTSSTTVSLWDLTTQQEAFSNSSVHTEVIQSSCWKRDGTLLVTSCKDKRLRVLDPRAGGDASVVLDVASHQNIKDSRVVWLGDTDKILTTGFDASRVRQVALRDVRRPAQPLHQLELQCSTGVLVPLYDPDTGMLFLAGKGDTTVLYMELLDRDPYFVEGLRHSGEQTKGACLVPKRALRVMEGEVNRLLQLTSSSVIPITYQVPRKTYRDYHADLYPDTAACRTTLAAPAWLAGHNHVLATMSLDPAKRSQHEKVHRGPLSDVVKEMLAMPVPNKHEQKPITTPQQSASVKLHPKPVSQTESAKFDEEKIEFINVKDLIKGMEKGKAENMCEPDNKVILESDNVDNSPEWKTRGRSAHDGQNNFIAETLPTDMENNENVSGDLMNVECLSRGASILNGNGGVIPPKPLPRSSISEGGAGEDGHHAATNGVPKPRPRTTQAGANTYKPRLGPKPFSASQGSEEFSFDKVFSVPAAPGQLTSPASPPASKEPPRKTSTPTSEVDATLHKDGDYSNGKSDSSVEEEVNSEDSGYKPKTPGTVDRRKMFETELSGGGDTVDDMQLERGGARGSIAQRRRLYERSTSHQEQPKSPTLLRRRDSLKARKSPEEEKRVAAGTKRTSTVFGRVSKFRHLKGTPLHKSTHIENIKNISRQISAESNGFHGNGCRVAVSVGGGGGRVAVLELPAGATPVSRGASDPPRTAPALLHAAALCDWRFDPFRPDRLVVACDDGAVREWIIPDGGLKESTNEPARSWAAHADKMSTVEWHPRAADLLASAGHDLALRLWDLSPPVPVLWRALLGHTDQIHALAWSPCGNYLATVCKDGLIRIFKPRASCETTSSGRGPAGGRGARVVWALDGTHLVVTGFDKVSERQVLVYSVTDLSAPLTTLGLDVSPAILQPHYDEDSSTLFLTGRGDSTIYCLEVCGESPWLQALSHHRCASLHQGVAWLHKSLVQAERVEFARALRLASANIEPLSFTVPRVRSELFQDDLFPETRVTWEASCSAAQWISGFNAPVRRVSLRPPGMDLLSEHTATHAPVQVVSSPSGGQVVDQTTAKPTPVWSQAETKGKQDEILKSISARMEVNLTLEQDSMEGVDEAEWEQ